MQINCSEHLEGGEAMMTNPKCLSGGEKCPSFSHFVGKNWKEHG